MRKTKRTKMLRRQRKKELLDLLSQVDETYKAELESAVKPILDNPTAKWEDLTTLVKYYIAKSKLGDVC